MARLSFSVSAAYKAKFPIAVFLVPVVFEYRALYPLAVLLSPVVFEYRASDPIAVILAPAVSYTHLTLPTILLV